MEFNLAALFFSRESCLIAFAWNRLLHRDTITLECKSIHQGDAEAVFNDVQVPKAESTRVEVHMMTFEMRPKAGGWIDFAVLVNADPKIWFAPSMLINYVFKNVGSSH